MTILKVLSFLALASCVVAQTPTQVDFGTQVKNKNSYPVTQNTAGTNGGYMVFSPVTYNPYDGGTCLDMWGNPVQQPVPGAGQPAFGTNDLVLWNSLSPSMPFAPGTGTTGLVQNQVFTSNPVTTGPGPCGVPLPVNGDYGINTNGYFFGRAGLGTDNSKYNSIQSLQGGVTANSFTAGVLYPAGTQTTTGVLSVPAYLGGHVDTGHSSGPPSGTTIQTSTNPFSGGEGLVAGMIYYDDALHCEAVYSGTAWSCIGSSAGGGGVLPQNAITFGTGAGSTLNATTNLTYNPSTSSIVLARLGPNSGIIAPVFNADLTGVSGTVTTNNLNVTWASGLQFYSQMVGGNITINGGYYQVGGFTDSTHVTLSGGGNSPGILSSPVPYSFGNAFQSSTGSVQLTTGGTGLFQSVVSNSVFNSRADVTGGNVLQSSTGNMHIDGSGNGFFQSVSLTNGWSTVGGASLTSGGVLTVTSCSGCGAGGGGGGGGSAGGPLNSLQFNSPLGSFAGDGNLTWNASTRQLTLLGAGGTVNGIIAPLFNANGGGTNLEFQGSNFSVRGNGTVALNGSLNFGQSLSGDPAASTGGANIYYNASAAEFRASYSILGGAYTGLRSPVFNCTATGTTNCIQQTTGVFTIKGDGSAAFQTLGVGAGGPPAPFNVDNVGNISTTGTFTGVSGAFGGGGQLTISNTGVLNTSGNVTFGATFNVGTHGGSTAISGGGAAISNNTNNIALFTYDTGGVCGIGSGEPAPGISCSSDERLKKNISALDPALSDIMRLRPVNYDWKGNNAHGVGFIAQEVREILPLLVREQDSYLMLSVDGMIPYLVKAIQEQQKEIDALRADIPSRNNILTHGANISTSSISSTGLSSISSTGLSK